MDPFQFASHPWFFEESCADAKCQPGLERRFRIELPERLRTSPAAGSCRLAAIRHTSLSLDIPWAAARHLLHALGRNAGRVRRNGQLTAAEPCRTEVADDLKCVLHEINVLRHLKP